MTLDEAFQSIVAALEARSIDYAVVGALALAIHGVPRATTDIDLLVREEQIPDALDAVRPLGFDVRALPMRFSDGMEVRRVSRIEGRELLTLDLLVVNANLEEVWRSRCKVSTLDGSVSVISRDALVQMKAWAGRPQDAADIERLRDLDR